MAGECISIFPLLVQFSPILNTEYTLSPDRKRKDRKEPPVKDEQNSRLSGTECILMVDDEQSLRDVAEYALSRLGYKVMLASDGETALQLYRERKDEISLIVLDLIMPGMGGKRCLEQLLQTDPRARIIVVSGYTDEEPPGGFLGLGAREFVTKPYDMKDLTKLIRNVLESR